MMTAQQAFALALQHHQAGRLAEAEALYRQILAVQPNHPAATHHIGVIAQQCGKNDLAVNWIKQAIDLDPSDFAAHFNLGAAYRSLGRFDESIAAHQCAVQLHPDHAENYNAFGVALAERNRLDEAEAAFRRALEIKPDYVEARCNLGIALERLGRYDEATTAHHQALELKPDYAQAHGNLGSTLFCMGQLDAAVGAYRQAIQLKSDYWQAWNDLGNTLKDNGQPDEAITAHRQAMACRPNYPEAHSNLLVTLNYHSGLDPAAVYEEHLGWNRQHAEPLRRFIQAPRNDRTPDRRLRIGYVSPDFCDHPVGHFLLPLLARHDHEHFEIFCYAQVPAPDGMTQQLRAHADQWHSHTGLSNAQAADLIRQHQIDILVDLSGHTSRNRLLHFAHRPAPVQVTWLGYPNTTGLATMDYRLTDAFADPPGLTESWHAEQLVRLPRCGWCYQPSDSPPVTLRREGPITFGSFNNFAKITEPTLLLWARILHAVPGSRLLLKTWALGSRKTRASGCGRF